MTKLIGLSLYNNLQQIGSKWIITIGNNINYQWIILMYTTRQIKYILWHRWALSPISVMSDIGLSLYRTVRYRTERLKICRIFRYRTKVFSDIRYPTSKFLKSCCTRSLKKQTELNLHLATVTFESFDYLILHQAVVFNRPKLHLVQLWHFLTNHSTILKLEWHGS